MSLKDTIIINIIIPIFIIHIWLILKFNKIPADFVTDYPWDDSLVDYTSPLRKYYTIIYQLKHGCIPYIKQSKKYKDYMFNKQLEEL